MQDGKALSLEQIREFLQASDEIHFKGQGRAAIYAWVARTLRQQRYSRQDRAAKGLLRQYLAKMTGLSRAQITRLIRQHRQGGDLQPARYRRHRFARQYTPADVALLAAVDEAHETLSGPATRKILEREYQQYKQGEYERLAGISVAHLYRLRRRRAYRQRRLHFTKTRPTAVSIGERRRPHPQGQPGYLRVDTVHQGDLDGVKGVYHINAVDEVTQWQVVGATAAISEAWLEPVLAAILQQFPFRVRGFHSPNGSEFLPVLRSRTRRVEKQERAVEMTGDGKRGKPKAGFPSFPNALGNRYAIPPFPQPRRRFSLLPNQSQKGAPATPLPPTPSGSSFDEKMLRQSCLISDFAKRVLGGPDVVDGSWI